MTQIESDDHLEPSKMYRPGKQLAHGGMGAILEATDANLRRLVAMKVMLAGKRASRENQLRFIQEAKVLSQLEHPNIVPIYEMGLNEEGQVFYTMKLVKGRTLHEVLEEVKAGQPEALAEFSLAKLLTVFQKVCDAISFAHSTGVIHRDLKPGNIMLGEHGEVLVMDWGLAKILDREPAVKEASAGCQEPPCEAAPGKSEAKGGAGFPGAAAGERPAPASFQGGERLCTMEGKIMGTPNFMAPEQAEGRVGEIDARTDIFALGGILYNLLTLRVPAEGATAGEVLDKIKRGQIAPPVSYNRAGGREPDGTTRKQPLALAHCPGGKVPEALSAVAMKALSLRAAERYQSVAELQQDITAYQNGFATLAELPGPLTLMRLWVRRHRTSFAIAVSAAAFLSVASILVILMWWELRGTAPVFFDKAQALVSQQKFAEALTPIRYALQKTPPRQEYWVLKGNILESLLRVEEAKTAYQHALGLKAGDPSAKQNWEVCQRILRDNQGRRDLTAASLALLQSAMRSQGRKEEADALLRRLLAQDQAQRTVFYQQWRRQLD